MAFTDRLEKAADSVWQAMLAHPFLKGLADGSLPRETFDFWAQQDYVFVREARRFFAVLLAKAPESIQPAMTQTLTALENELKLFQDYAREQGFSLDVTPTPVCHAYICFLLASAYGEEFPGAFTVLYGAEKAYLDSWLSVKNQVKGMTPYQRFIDNWTSPGFQDYVRWLGENVNRFAERRPEGELHHFEGLYTLTARYEYLFWEMVYRKQTWPL